MKSNISVESFSAWFSVETKHGSRLEFVLSDADDRNGNPRHHEHVFTTYVDHLWGMFKGEFERSKTISVREVSEYGDVMFLVQAATAAELDKALARCGVVVGRWINKYRVNHMTEGEGK